MSDPDPTLDELDAFLSVMYPMTWAVTSHDNQQARRDMYRKAIAAAIGQARRNDSVVHHDHPEWKEGYRDGLTGARSAIAVCDTAAEGTALIDELLESADRLWGKRGVTAEELRQ